MWSHVKNIITVIALVILPRTAQRKFPHQETSSPWQIMFPLILQLQLQDRSQPFHHRCSQENALTGQGQISNLNVAETPATTRDMYPTPHFMTTAPHNTHLLTDALGDTLAGTSHIGTAAPIHNTTHVTSEPLLWLLNGPKPVYFKTLLWYCPQIVYTEGIKTTFMESNPPIDPSIRRRSLFRTHSQTLSQNEMMNLIL